MATAFLWISLALVVFTTVILLREDWKFLRLGRAHVRATVSGHKRSLDEGHENFAAQFRFATDHGETIQITDAVLQNTAEPPVGTTVDLVYPNGRPDLARRPRPFLRSMIYVTLLAMNAILAARLANFL